MLGLRKPCKRFILLISTICVMTAISCIVVIAKASVLTEKINIPVQTNSYGLFETDEFNTSERAVLTLLHNGIEETHIQNVQEDTIPTTYFKYLEEYLGSSGVDLSASKVTEVEAQIQNLNEIMNLEKESDFKKMSLDGRGMAIFLSQQIYELCGLTLTYSILGDIEQITETSGQVIYQKENPIRQAGLHINALVITLIVMVILLILCIMLAKKNQLFAKESINIGYDEERLPNFE